MKTFKGYICQICHKEALATTWKYYLERFGVGCCDQCKKEVTQHATSNKQLGFSSFK